MLISSSNGISYFCAIFLRNFFPQQVPKPKHHRPHIPRPPTRPMRKRRTNTENVTGSNKHPHTLCGFKPLQALCHISRNAEQLTQRLDQQEPINVSYFKTELIEVKICTTKWKIVMRTTIVTHFVIINPRSKNVQGSSVIGASVFGLSFTGRKWFCNRKEKS